jgi:hypothetical protein
MKYLALVLAGTSLAAAPLVAQTTTPPGAPATPGAAPAAAAGATPTVGAKVVDGTGAPVGTIEAVANGTATVNTGTAKAGVPLNAFAARDGGFAIGMTKAELEAAVAGAKPAEIAVGTAIKGPQGASVGKVEAVSGDLVTVATPTTKVQLPKNAFAQAADGTLQIGMTPEQLEAAAKAAGAPKAGTTK